MTHNQFIAFFRDFATNHKQVNAFGNGQKDEVNGVVSTDFSYPFMWAIIKEANIDGNIFKPKYLFVFGDIVNKDQSNIDEVLSDQLRIAKDFVSTLRLTDYEASFQIDKQTSFTPFEEEVYANECAGWEIEITFNTDFTQDTCQVPTSGSPAITGTDN